VLGWLFCHPECNEGAIVVNVDRGFLAVIGEREGIIRERQD